MKTLHPNKEHSVFFGQLGDDVKQAIALLTQSNGSQFARRVFLRTVTSDLEAKTEVLRDDLISAANAREVSFTFPELIILEKSNFDIKETGDIKDRGEKLYRTLDYIAFVFRMALRELGSDPTKFFGNNNWRLTQQMFTVRNRITHPKIDGEFRISTQELKDIQKAYAWMAVQFLSLYGLEIEAAKKAGL